MRLILVIITVSCLIGCSQVTVPGGISGKGNTQHARMAEDVKNGSPLLVVPLFDDFFEIKVARGDFEYDHSRTILDSRQVNDYIVNRIKESLPKTANVHYDAEFARKFLDYLGSTDYNPINADDKIFQIDDFSEIAARHSIEYVLVIQEQNFSNRFAPGFNRVHGDEGYVGKGLGMLVSEKSGTRQASVFLHTHLFFSILETAGESGVWSNITPANKNTRFGIPYVDLAYNERELDCRVSDLYELKMDDVIDLASSKFRPTVFVDLSQTLDANLDRAFYGINQMPIGSTQFGSSDEITPVIKYQTGYYLGFDGDTILRNFSDAQACVDNCLASNECVAATYSNSDGPEGWENTCILNAQKGPRIGTGAAVVTWDKPEILCN